MICIRIYCIGCLLEGRGEGEGEGSCILYQRQLKTKNLSIFANHLHATLSLEIVLKSIFNYMRFVKIGNPLGTYILHAQPPLITYVSPLVLLCNTCNFTQGLYCHGVYVPISDCNPHLLNSD